MVAVQVGEQHDICGVHRGVRGQRHQPVQRADPATEDRVGERHSAAELDQGCRVPDVGQPPDLAGLDRLRRVSGGRHGQHRSIRQPFTRSRIISSG
jgi:hypothetical protein